MFNNLQKGRDATSADDTSGPMGEGASAANRPREGFLGMTAGQRLAVSILILITVCILGVTCLLVTGAIAIPSQIPNF
jgi:hypothetical protein